MTEGIEPEALARLALPVNIGLVVLLAHGLAELTWRLLPVPTMAPSTVLASREGEPAGTAAQGADTSAIAGWHLFGRVDEAPAPAPRPAPREIPETRLNLTLTGILYAEGDARPLAIIRGAGDRVAFTLGEELPGSGAKIEEIARDRVVLLHNGQPSTLKLERESVAASAPPPARARSRRAVPQAFQSSVDASGLAGEIREMVQSRPAELLNVLRFRPRMENGLLVGYQVLPGRRRDALRQLGMRPGDVITAVDGVPAMELDLATLRGSLISANAVNLQIRRGSSEHVLTVQLQP